MKQVKLKVTLLDVTKDSIDLIYASARQCYSKLSASEITKNRVPLYKKENFIKKVVSSGHESITEHAKFTFSVEGISRVTTHQLVRHRLASYSQQSQRYVGFDDIPYIIPPVIKNNKKAQRYFLDTMKQVENAYKELIKIFESEAKNRETKNQDVRYILPSCVETKIVISMNCRELLHFFRLRCCARAQWEIRNLAREMLKICKKKLPAVFCEAGPKCVQLGYCPEGQFSCGRYPVKR